MSDSSLSPLTARDGTNLVVIDWPLSKGPVRGVVLIVHGLGEHAWRYDHVAERLNGWGFAVRAYDQYGHGESMGPRGALPSSDRLLSDLAEVVDESRERMNANTPLIVLGHSKGSVIGTVASREKKATAFISLCGPAENMLKIVRSQYQRRLKGQDSAKLNDIIYSLAAGKIYTGTIPASL